MATIGIGLGIALRRGIGVPAPTPAPAPGPTPTPAPGPTPTPGGWTPTPPAYADAFDGVADGTPLIALAGWNALTTNSPAAVFTGMIGVAGGRVANVNGNVDYSQPPHALIARDAGGADHFFRARVGTSNDQTRMMFGASDQRNHLTIRIASGNMLPARIVAGIETDMPGTGGLQPDARFPNARTIRAGDRIEGRVVGGVMTMLKDGIPMRADRYFAVEPLPPGRHAGFSTFADCYVGWDDVEMGPLACDLSLDPLPQAFVPRRRSADGAGSAPIAIAGGYRGTMAGLVWRLRHPETGAVLNDWTHAAAPVIGEGRWAATIAVPAGLNGAGAYRLEVAAANDTQSAVQATAPFSVGIAILMYGQSNTSGMANSTATVPAVAPGAWTYHRTWDIAEQPPLPGGWRNATRYLGEDFPRNDAVLGGALSAATGLPVGLINCGIPARGAEGLRPGRPEFDWAATHIGHAGGAFEAILINQGENEAFATGAGSTVTYIADWQDTIAALRAICGQPAGTTIPVLMAVTGRFDAVPAGAMDANSSILRRLQAELIAADGASAALSHHHVGVRMIDEYHYSSDAEGYPEMARRIARSVAKHWGLAAHDGLGPKALNPSRAGRVVTVPVDLNGAVAIEGSGLTSWQASADGFATLLAIESVGVAGSAVEIRLVADPGGPVAIRNHQGARPDVSSWVIGREADGSGIPMMPILTGISTAG